MDGAGGFEGVFLDEGDGGDARRLSCFGDGDEGFFLLVVEVAHLPGEGMGLFLEEAFQGDQDVVFIDRLFGGDAGEDVVQEIMDIIGVPIEEVVGQFCGPGEDIAPGFLEL